MEHRLTDSLALRSASPWRRREPDPGARSALESEQKRETDIFQQALEKSRLPETPLRELFAAMLLLVVPHINAEQLEKTAMRSEEEALRWSDSLDEEGNPRWISLTLQDRRSEEKKVKPDSVLPGAKESAAPRDSFSKEDEESQAIPKRENFLFSSLEFIVRRFRTDGEEEYAQPADIYLGKGTLPPPRPRPLRSFFRMLLLSLCLGIIYHFLAQKGWVPGIF